VDKMTVVMPVYNAEPFLRQSLDSVLGQDYPNWECIAVDDGATDSSGRILDEYAARDPRFRIVHKKNGGEGSARNAATPLITGDLVTYLDADDCLCPYALSAIAEIHAETRFDVMRYELRQVSSHAGAVWPSVARHAYERIDYHACGESPFRFCALGCATVVTCEIARQVPWPDLREGADLVFVLDCLMRADVTVRTREQYVDYLVHPNSISHRLSAHLLEGTCEYIPLMLEKADAYGMREDMWQASRAHVREMMLRKMFGSWKLMESREERESVRMAYWRAMERLAERSDVFSAMERGIVKRVARGNSDLLAGLALVLPYRIRRKFVR